MNAEPRIAAPRIAEADIKPARRETRLRAWRRRQMVWDKAKKARRSMRLTDIHDLHGIPVTTWHNWERWPDEQGFRRPDEQNMQLLFNISNGEITPDWFYSVDEWAAALAEAGG